MTMFFDGIDASDSFDGSFEAIPAGVYKAVIKDVEIEDKNLKDYSETGHPYVLEWEIVEGPEKGRKINQNLFVHHEDEKKKKRGLLIMAVLYTIAGKDIKTISGAPKVEELAKIICNKKMQIKIETKDTKKIMEDGEEKVFKNSFVNGISKIETKKVIDEDGDDIPM